MELFKLLGKIVIENKEANAEIDGTTDKAEDASSKMSDSFKKIGSAVATYFAVDKIIDFGKQCVNTAAEVSAEASAFEQIMGNYSDEAAAKVGKIADATGMVDTRLTPYMTSMTAKFKGLGYDVDDATGFASRGLNLAADAAAFWDKSLNESMSHLNSFINGSYEGGEAIGLFANDTQLASYAVKTGLISETKEWASLDEARKQATRLEYAENMMKASGATGQAAKEAGQYANVQANLNEKWRQFQADIGEPILQNIVIPAMEKTSGIVDKLATGFQTASKWCKENQTALQLIAIAVGTFATAITAYKIAQNAATIVTTIATTATTAFGSAMAFVTSPVTLVVAAIGALIAIGVLLYKNWDTIKEKATELWAKVKEIFGNIKDWIVEKFTAIKDKTVEIFTAVKDWISEKIESIKQVFTTLWEHIKSVFDTIKNVISVAIQFIGQIFSAAFQIITLPFRFIWENCKEYVFAAWEWIKEKISTAVNAIKDVISTVWNAIKDFLTPILETIKNVILTAWNAIKSAIQTAMNAIKSVVTTVWNGIKSVVTSVLNAIKSFVTSVWNSIKSAVSSAVNAIKTVVTNAFNAVKSTVSNIFNSVKSTVSNVWNNIKTSISNTANSIKSTVSSKFEEIKSKMLSPIEKAREKIKGLIDKIKGYFDNLKLKLPKIKLPHFKISGEFSLDPPSAPKFSIEWYKKAMNAPMVLNDPTIFGYNPATGSLMGGGEAGSEVVSGVGSLVQMIRGAVAAENNAIVYYLNQIVVILADYFPQLLEAFDVNMSLDSDLLVAGIAPKMNKQLAIIKKQEERGR